MSVIKLQSSDGEIFDVEIEIAKASNTIKNMIEGKRKTGTCEVFFLVVVVGLSVDCGKTVYCCWRCVRKGGADAVSACRPGFTLVAVLWL